MYLFSPLAIYGRNPDLNLTACVSQIRSVLCIQAISQGHRQILCPRPMRAPESNVFRSQAFGIPGAAFFALQHGPKRTCDLCTAALVPQTVMDSSQASLLLVTVSHILPRVSILSTRHGVPRTWQDFVLDIIHHHIYLGPCSQSKMIIIECFLIIDTKRCPAP